MKLRQYEGRFSKRSIFHKTQLISRFIPIFSHYKVAENLFTSIVYRKRPIHMTSYEQVYRFLYSVITFKIIPQHIYELIQDRLMATYITPPFITEFKLVPCRAIYTNHLITYKQLSLRRNLQIEPSNHLLSCIIKPQSVPRPYGLIY